MELKFGNVKLRAIEMKDANLLRNLMNSSGVESMTIGWNLPVSEYAQNEWIRNFRNSTSLIRWMIDLDGGATLGMMILSDIDWKNRSANIGTKINIAERDRLHGDLNNAQYAVIKYAFEELGLNRIECSILDYNTFSKRLVKNLGFVKEGVCRSKIFKRDSWHDVEIYSMIKSDFVHYRDGVAPWQIKD